MLIIGGGDGRILPLLFRHGPDLNIEFLEASASMIKLAKRRVNHLQRVTFTHNDRYEYTTTPDIIFCPFVWDLVKEEVIAQQIRAVEERQKRIPVWAVTDFQWKRSMPIALWRKMQLKLTILFFRITTKHTLKHLPDIFGVYEELGYKPLLNITLRGEFIRGTTFTKSRYEME